MPRTPLTFSVVRSLALKLPDVEESSIHGEPSLKLSGKLLACPAIHKSAEPGTLAVRIDFDERDKLIASEPGIYYLTEHYANYPTVLVRLSRISRAALRDLLN